MAPRIRPYKDFLTPALHRRFAMATSILFSFCYLETFLIKEWKGIFWSWFPLGPAGIQALLLFVPAFMIFILRVSQLHVGSRTSFSGFETFQSYLLRFETVQTTGWYFLSAWVFSEIYIWSVPTEADLNRIKLVKIRERPVLNEKPIYLTSCFFLMAALQSFSHLYYDYDKIKMPVAKLDSATAPDGKKISVNRSPPVENPGAQVKGKLIRLISTAVLRAFVVSAVGPFVYALNIGIPFVFTFKIRGIAWSFTRSWATIFWNLPKSGALPAVFPFHWEVLLRSLTGGTLLILLWELGNAAFSAYVAQPPLKDGRPITFESRDPNGSLLTGLKGKKLQTRAFAFWELVLIATEFEGRRKAIFEDIDRAGGTAWSQISAACLENIKGIDSRINEYQNPTKPQAPPNAAQAPIKSLPQIAEPLKDGLQSSGDLFSPSSKAVSSRGKMAQAVTEFAKNPSSPPADVKGNAMRALSKAEGVVFTPEQRKTVGEQGVGGLFQNNYLWFLKSPCGKPFRYEYRRKMAAVVLGQPYGDAGIIVNAVASLTQLAVYSLAEDRYGNVQSDVRNIILTLTSSLTRLHAFKSSAAIHWTDVDPRLDTPETDVVLASLRDGLADLLAAFGHYQDVLRLTKTELRLAREAVATTEMSQVR